MKLLKKSAMWIVLVVYFLLAFSFVKSRFKAKTCNTLNIVITDSTQHAFIITEDVLKILENRGIRCLGVPLKEIDLALIEEAVTSNQIVDECRVYKDINGVLTIEVSQREPIARIFEINGKGYYLDREGNVMDLSLRRIPHVLVVNGHFHSSVEIGKPENIYANRKDTSMQKLLEIHELAKYIDQHPLWKYQIVQLYVTEKGEFEVIPRIGGHQIILGSAEHYQEKFDKLEYLYKEGLSYEGWNKYDTINLKYRSQIVCSKI